MRISCFDTDFVSQMKLTKLPLIYCFVSGATCSLSVLLLIGVISMYLLNVAFMLSDHPVTCGVRRFGLSFFYCLIYACLLIRAIRIHRLWNACATSDDKRPPFINGCSQTVLVLVLLCIEFILVTEWLVLKPPDVKWYIVDISSAYRPPLYELEWRCLYDKTDLVASLSYAFGLVVLTLIVASLAHESNQFQGEAKCIIVMSVGSIILMVAWILVYVIAPKEFDQPAVCIGKAIIYFDFLMPKYCNNLKTMGKFRDLVWRVKKLESSSSYKN